MMALISTPEMDNFAGVVAGERMSARAYRSQKPWRPYDSLYSGIAYVTRVYLYKG